MADEQYPSHLNETAAMISGIFRRRLWEKEDTDFRAGQVKQFEKRVMAAGQRAAMSTPDMDPDAPAEVPKEMILAVTDLKMAAAQYKDNPLIAKTADTYYQAVMSSVKELMGHQAQQSEVELQGAQAANQQESADRSKAERDAGMPEAQAKLANAQAGYYDRMPEQNGTDASLLKSQMVFGEMPGSIRSVAGAIQAIKLWQTKPVEQGGPNRDGVTQGIDSVRQQMAMERYGKSLIGKRKDPNNPADQSVWTVKEVADEKIPFEDAKNRWEYDRISEAIAAGKIQVSPEEWAEKAGSMAYPGEGAPLSVAPGQTMTEEAIFATTVGPDRVGDFETNLGKPIKTAKDAIAALPENMEDMLYGTGPVPMALSSAMSTLEDRPEVIEELRSMDAGARDKAIAAILRTRAYDMIDDTFKVKRRSDGSDLPESTGKNREVSRKIADAAIDKYAKQAMVRLGIVSIKEAPKKESTYSLISPEVMATMGKLAKEGPTGKLVKGVKTLLTPEVEEIK